MISENLGLKRNGVRFLNDMALPGEEIEEFRFEKEKSIEPQFFVFLLILSGLFFYYLFNHIHVSKSNLSSSISESISKVKNCTCTEWIQKNCGGGNCKRTERLELRNCTPVGCEPETR
jgi:hypothetical protein